jgi:exopolysaccharide biosynthesis predicted pyruvyltransferase EpsI
MILLGRLLDNLSLFRGGRASSGLRPFRAQTENELRALARRRVLYFPNPGNAGDSLIAAGTYQALRRCGIPLVLADLDSPVDGATLLLGGGGNLVPYYDHIATALARFHGRAARLVLLPHTIRGHEALLAQLDGSCTLLCRDRPSLDHLRAVNPRIDARLRHDMALHLDAPGLLADPVLAARARPVWEARLAAAGLSPALLSRPEGVSLLRLDVETTAAAPWSDGDVSAIFMLGTGPEEAPIAAWCLLKSVSLAQRIVTDRLHVAIAAALLGVPCDLHDNIYGKNAAVYDHSLRGFACLRFVAG